MPKIAIKKKSTSVDMTAMCDVSFLLLTFFILTSKFKPAEPVAIDMPSSRSEITVPDVIKIAVDKEGRAFVSYPNEIKKDVMEKFVSRYGETYPYMKALSPKQKANFASLEMIGIPMNAMPDALAKGEDFYNDVLKQSKGIPMDSADNQLKDWITAGRMCNAKLRIAIKGDKNSDVLAVQKVIKTLTDNDIHTFNLITTLAGGSKKQ